MCGDCHDLARHSTGHGHCQCQYCRLYGPKAIRSQQVLGISIDTRCDWLCTHVRRRRFASLVDGVDCRELDRFTQSSDDGGDHYDDDGTHTEMQGVDAAEQEPTMIGDGVPLPAIHTVPEEVVPQVMEPEDLTMQPMGVATIDPTTDEPVAGAPVVTGATAAPCLPGTEQELRRLEINEEEPVWSYMLAVTATQC